MYSGRNTRISPAHVVEELRDVTGVIVKNVVVNHVKKCLGRDRRLFADRCPAVLAATKMFHVGRQPREVVLGDVATHLDVPVATDPQIATTPIAPVNAARHKSSPAAAKPRRPPSIRLCPLLAEGGAHLLKWKRKVVGRSGIDGGAKASGGGSPLKAAPREKSPSRIANSRDATCPNLVWSECRVVPHEHGPMTISSTIPTRC